MGVPPWQIACDEVWHCMPCSPHTGQHTICKLQGWAFQLNDRPIVQTLAQTHIWAALPRLRKPVLFHAGRGTTVAAVQLQLKAQQRELQKRRGVVLQTTALLWHTPRGFGHMGGYQRNCGREMSSYSLEKIPRYKTHTLQILTALFIWLGPFFSSVAEPLPVDAVSTQEKLAASWQSL